MSMNNMLADRERSKAGLGVGRRRLRISLGTWRRLARQIDGKKSCLSWQTRIAYYLAGAGSSLLGRIQHGSHADKIKAAIPAPPLFLLGFWRSGTTFLHELFCC